jgi:hypothetical protein
LSLSVPLIVLQANDGAPMEATCYRSFLHRPPQIGARRS